MSSFQYKLSQMTMCNQCLNRRVICMKRSWDEVSHLLDELCHGNSCCKKSRKPKHPDGCHCHPPKR